MGSWEAVATMAARVVAAGAQDPAGWMMGARAHFELRDWAAAEHWRPHTLETPSHPPSTARVPSAPSRLARYTHASERFGALNDETRRMDCLENAAGG